MLTHFVNSALRFFTETPKVCEVLGLAVVVDGWPEEAEGEKLHTLVTSNRARLAFPPALVWRETEKDEHLRFPIIRFLGAVYTGL